MCRKKERKKERKKVKSLSHVRLLVTPWTVAYQASLSMVFSKQEYWSGLPFPSPGNLADLGTEPGSPALEADALTSEPPGTGTMYVYYVLIRQIYTHQLHHTCDN